MTLKQLNLEIPDWMREQLDAVLAKREREARPTTLRGLVMEALREHLHLAAPAEETTKKSRKAA